jgi:GT2 family glycosyltransferase
MRALNARLDSMAATQESLRADLIALGNAVCRVEQDLQQAIHAIEDSLTSRNVLPADRVAYRRMVARLRELVRAEIGSDAVLVVIGKADDDLLTLPPARVWRFPQASDGAYTGFYPACSTSAIAHLALLRSRGADFLVVPETCRWWLSHYADFGRHLVERYRCIADEAGSGMLFSLREAPTGQDIWRTLDEASALLRSESGHDPAILDWNTGLNLVAKLPDRPVFEPPPNGAGLPYLDRSIDIVALGSADLGDIKEANRVATAAVIRVAESGPPALDWMTDRVDAGRPTASLIIPCFNGVAHTDACLSALSETLPHDFDGEVIVVDDASSDETAERLNGWTRRMKALRIIRNRTNLGFVRSINKGAKAANGEVLVFLNNDTIPLAGWLRPLLRVLEGDPRVGAAGGRLVYPDGRLQECGGVVFRDGSAANFGRDDLNPDSPLYTFLRDVDYCSAALMATRRSLFMELGGFDLDYAPGYYEDTDYCFRLRDKGHRVVVQPESVVVHVEGGTAGLDVTHGMKRFQVVNREKFQERWRAALAQQPDRPGHFDFKALHGLATAARPGAQP